VLGLPQGRSHAETNWYSHGGDETEANFSRLTQIDTRNVGQLGLAWSMDLPGEVSLEGTPLAIDGTLYFTGGSCIVYAVDAASGRLLWKYDPETWKYRPTHLKATFTVNRGAAFADGRLFVGTLDGRLVALDARTGKLIWSTATVPDDSVLTITGAPWVVKGNVLIGNGGADIWARGYVTAYDAATGKLVWRFYTVPGNPSDRTQDETSQMATRTWGGEWWTKGGGGTVWDNMTYDPQLNRIYIGVGNAGPWNPRTRSPGDGDNLFIASIVALDADTGRYVWHYQANPRESWDFKATANMIVAELVIEGRTRKVLMQSPTNGFFYVLDRTDGKLISAEKTGKVTWAKRIDVRTGRPVESADIRYANGPVEIWPSPYGTHSWQGMSYSAQSGLVYIPYMQLGSRYTDDGVAEHNVAEPSLHHGGLFLEFLVQDKEDGKGALLAWDPVKQRQRWKVQHASFWNGGVLSTLGGLVFQGTGDGELAAYDAANGRKLWAFDAKHGIIASPISYTAGGRQYVSILVGYGGALGIVSNLTNLGWKFGAQPRRLLTFALGAKGQLPPTAPRDYTLHPLDDPSLDIDARSAQSGERVYRGNCVQCHGVQLKSAGAPAPDLRESAVALSWDSFVATVRDGALVPKFMPRFADLEPGELRDLYMYVRSAARDAAAPGHN
jgi:quinohemoprotein ethanol dehydrogenase